MANAAAERIEPHLEEAGDSGRPAAYVPPLPRVSIQAFCETPAVQAALSQAAADRRAARAHMTVQTGGLAAALEFYTDAATPNVIVVETMARGSSLLSELDRLADVCDPGTRVVVIGHANDIGLYRELISRGVSEYLVAPVTALEALDTLSRLFHSANAGPLGRIIAFVGAKGGVGSSTVAHNVAWSISQEIGSDVAIADLDLAFGTAGLDFNQDPPQGIAEAVYAGDRLDEVYLERLFTKCTDHLSLIAAPATLDREYDLPGSSFEPVIDLIRKSVPVVVLDVPHLWSAWTKATLLAADEVVITAMPDLANLRNAKNLIDVLKQARPNDPPPIVVLNQVGVPKKPEISAREFGAALEVQPAAVIPFDPVLFTSAANNGQMIAEMQAGAKPVEMFRALAEQVTGKAEAKRHRRSPLGPLLERLIGRRKA